MPFKARGSGNYASPCREIRPYDKKVASIREATANYSKPLVQPRSVEALLCELHPATLTEVTALIKKSTNKQCELDPMQMWLHMDMCSVIATVITLV